MIQVTFNFTSVAAAAAPGQVLAAGAEGVDIATASGVLRVPKGSYAVDFVIFENAIDGVAWGNAPMGLKLNVAQTGEPFMNFGR